MATTSNNLVCLLAGSVGFPLACAHGLGGDRHHWSGSWLIWFVGDIFSERRSTSSSAGSSTTGAAVVVCEPRRGDRWAGVAAPGRPVPLDLLASLEEALDDE